MKSKILIVEGILKMCNKGFSILFILLFACIILPAQQNTDRETELENALELVRKNPTLDAKNVFLPLEKSYKDKGDTYYECRVWLYLAVSIPASPESNPYRLECFQKYFDLSNLYHYDDLKWGAMRNIADIHIQRNEFDEAEKLLLEIIQPENNASRKDLLLTYDLISWLYILKADMSKALNYALKAQRTMLPADSSLAVTFYDRLATIYGNLNEPEESIKWSEKAYQSAIQNKDWPLASAGRGTVMFNLIRLGKKEEALSFVLNSAQKTRNTTPGLERDYLAQLAFCYVTLKKYDLAEEYYIRIENLLAEKAKDFSINEKAISYNRIGQFYLTTHRPQIAKQHFLQAFNGYHQLGNTNSLKDIYQLLFKADSALGNYKSAIIFLQKSNTIKDSIFNSTKNKQIKELQIAFETEQKNKDIKELQNKAQLQELTLQHSESTRNWIVLGTFLLAIIAIILYRQVKMTRKASRIITQNNGTLQRLVKEKEWLLKEVHHRVKNNLHTVISLLESQARYLENDALTAVETSQHRIFAMCLIHQKLYNSENVKTIDMASYITELVINLEKSYSITDQIRFNLKIDSIALDISHAIPLGLIINEAVTNSLKHAFPGGQKGNIAITLSSNQNKVILEIADDGTGMPSREVTQETQTLGIELMKGLCTDIDADIKFETLCGVRIIISFDSTLSLERDPVIETESVLLV